MTSRGDLQDETGGLTGPVSHSPKPEEAGITRVRGDCVLRQLGCAQFDPAVEVDGRVWTEPCNRPGHRHRSDTGQTQVKGKTRLDTAQNAGQIPQVKDKTRVRYHR